MSRSKFVAIVLLAISGVFCCPYARSLTDQARSFATTENLLLFENPAAASKCTKSDFTAPTSTRASICTVYSEILTRLDGLVGSNVALPSSIFGSALRLVFHDAGEVDMTKPADQMGPDGCLASDGSSDGLTGAETITMKYFEPMWQDVCDQISRADFWAMLGYITLQKTILPPIPMMYLYGRRDNIGCEGGAGRLPKASGNLSEIDRVFVRQMGLSLEDAGKCDAAGTRSS
jgi:hypothetical protein